MTGHIHTDGSKSTGTDLSILLHRTHMAFWLYSKYITQFGNTHMAIALHCTAHTQTHTHRDTQTHTHIGWSTAHTQTQTHIHREGADELATFERSNTVTLLSAPAQSSLLAGRQPFLVSDERWWGWFSITMWRVFPIWIINPFNVQCSTPSVSDERGCFSITFPIWMFRDNAWLSDGKIQISRHNPAIPECQRNRR